MNGNILGQDNSGVPFRKIQTGTQFYTYVNGGIETWIKLEHKLQVPEERVAGTSERLFCNAVSIRGFSCDFSDDTLVWISGSYY